MLHYATQRRTSTLRSSRDAFISIHFLRARVPAHYQFVSLADRILSRGDNVYAEGQCDLGADPKPEIVRPQIEIRIHRRGLTEPDDDFCAGHGEAFPRPNIEGNTF